MSRDSIELPLVGLLNDVLLPGETRAFRSPVVDAGTLTRLTGASPATLAVLCVTTRAELPALVGARWVTLADLIRVDADEVVLLGVSRARIKTATGGESPYTAQLLPQHSEAASDLAVLLTEAHRLLAALDLGARPTEGSADQQLRDALFVLARATMTAEQLNQALDLPLHEVLRKQAQWLTVDRAVEGGRCELEDQLRRLAETPELSNEQRQQLWSQVIAVQRRLDIYEPGVADTDVEEVTHLQRRLQQVGLPKAARVAAKRSLRQLRNMATTSHDYPVRLGHLEFMAQLPWHVEPPPALSLAALRRKLGADHFGLTEPKRRILEYFAVRELGGKAAGTVLCLAGPPGVGKTSLARSIAAALGRPLARVALGGVHDESEIRGHRLSFVAAAPGRILRGVAEAGSTSCVMLLDELDKVSYTEGRSPGAALLEVLDPEQNHAFRDNYLGVPYDLSHVLFLCTANEIKKISGPLRDRLEIIELEGYTLAEKVAIAVRHLVPKVARDCGLPHPPAIDVTSLERLIEGYTREAGVRELGRKLSALFRARALSRLERREAQPSPLDRGADDDARSLVTWDEVAEVLGPPRFRQRLRPETLPIGVATGLSVNAFGGSTLYVEVGAMPGTGEVRSTGQLGEVLRESVHAALAHIKMDPERYGIERRRLSCDLHVHLPEAAIAKDGPSAGVTVVAALLSVLREQPVPADLAMTGEITLTGDVLAVGGIRAKLLAAERAGMRRVLVPEDNRADVPRDLSLEVVYLERIEQMLRYVFTPAAERHPEPERPSERAEWSSS